MTCALSTEEGARQGQRPFCRGDKLVEGDAPVGGLGFELVDFVSDEQLEGAAGMFGDVFGNAVAAQPGELEKRRPTGSSAPDPVRRSHLV